MLAIATLLICMLILLADTLRIGISPMPTLAHEQKVVLEHIDPDFRGTIVDIGSGFGTMVRAFKKHAPHAHVIGIEKAVLPYLLSKLFLGKAIQYGDYTQKLPKGDLYYAYLFPTGMQTLTVDAPLLSLAFAYTKKEPKEVVSIGTLYPTKLYIY